MIEEYYIEEKIKALAEKKGIEFLSPPLDYRLSEENFHQYATADHFWIQWRFNMIKRILPQEAVSGQVLEIGCGRGTTARLIEEYYGCTVSGCDLDLAALCMDNSDSPRYFYDVYQLRKEFKGIYSVIFLLDVLEHIKEPVSFLRAVSFHLKEGGGLIVNLPSLQFLYSRYDKAQGHLKRYNFKLAKKELETAGFSIVKASYWGITMMLPLLFMRKILLNSNFIKHPVKTGFAGSSRFIYSILKLLKKFELTFFPYPAIGSSLFIVAKK